MDENEDLTPEEVEDIDENPGETPGEAHREGEFDDIRDRSTASWKCSIP